MFTDPMSDDDIDIFIPPPHPPVTIAGPDDAWTLCASLRADSDALLAVLVADDRRVVAAAAASPGFVARAREDPSPLVILIELFETRALYLSVASEEAEQLVGHLAAELAPAEVTIEFLPPLPGAA